MHSEEKTINYYLNHVYKPKYNPNRGDVELQKKANKFLKTCKSSEEWARFAYEHELEFQICKMDGHLTEAYLYQDFLKDIGIAFLDDDNDVFMIYTFRKEENGKYFLFDMIFWEWAENKKTDDDYTKEWIYTFEPNGNVQVVEREKDAEEECIWTSKKPLNVESNWQEKPAFGDWDGFFEMRRWADGELDEAFKGQNITTHIITDQGETIAKTNQPYNFLSVKKQEEVTNALTKAKEFHKKGEKDKVFETLQIAYNNIPKPKENYEATSQILLAVMDYHNLYKEHENALALLEKFEKHLNADNYYLLPLYKGKVYFEANQKQEAREQFNIFIQKNGTEILMKQYPEHYEIYRWNLM